ncbi:hypothetical protein VHEMI05823 [[Torrubiella] hemipterigena]|uniref:WSC domain-containing protein n=1 Tax=[Torrubiella] hemipterigena TaxID=1531966 RepID=A0A0A1TJN8_9HYPO|nr:hypothetical protein VHEMI05823 [[Torrubiella] hemipterigena]
MARHQRRTGFAALISLFVFVAFVNAVDFTFCAKTSPSSTPNDEQFQTNGLCSDNCGPKGFAYAVTNYRNCWCTNDAPKQSDKISRSSCSQGCPGFPDELCGGSNAYSWIQLKGPAQSPSITPSPSSTSSPSSSRRPSPSSSTASSPSSSSSSSSPKTSQVATTDTNGQVSTVIITYYPSSTSDHSSGGSDGNSGGLGTGAIVGIVVGIIGAILVIAGIILFMFLRKRKQQKEADAAAGSASGSRGRGSPSSPGSAGNRSSMLQIDPRMDPFNQGLYARSGSAESVNTLHDDHDYSRRIQAPKVLRATNPDPETGGAPVGVSS